MAALQKVIAALLLTQLLLSGGPTLAQTHLSGEVGADLGSYGFSNDIFGRGLNVNSDRRLANEYLDLNLRGPLAKGYFANYNTMLRVRGTQIRSEVGGESFTEYLNPDITSYYGALSLFPSRPFPLKFYKGKSKENSVQDLKSNPVVKRN